MQQQNVRGERDHEEPFIEVVAIPIRAIISSSGGIHAPSAHVRRVRCSKLIALADH